LETIYDVFFINESIGFAGGGQTHNSTTSALLLKTFDGGNTWVQKHVNTNISDIRKITFFNDNDGLVIGKSTKSITHDAGMSWEEVDAQIDGDLLGFFVLYENTAFVFTTWSDKLWKSTDKGETWEEIWMQESVYMKSIQFISEDIGFLGMQDIYKTDDGGYTWTIFEDAFSDINDLYFQDENNGVVFGTRFYIYNGDAAWKTDFNVLTNGVWNGDERVRDIELSCRIDHQTFYAINNLDEFIVIKLPT